MKPEQQKNIEKNTGAPGRVLVIDDSFDDRALYQRLLRGKFDLFEAENLKDGLPLALAGGFDCILLDHDLPDGNGLDFIDAFNKGHPEGGRVIVMVTGQGSEETAAEAMKRGALDYLPKSSVTAGSIARSISNAVEKNRLQAESAQHRQRLEKSCRALTDFAHTVSHDLKAPLRHIVSYCEMLRADYGDRLGEEGGNYTARLIINAQRMQRLVDDLLAYSELREEAEDKTLLDTGAAFRETLELLEGAVKQSGATVTAEGLPVIPAYPQRFKRLLMNLLSNALKYRSAAPPVIRLSCEERGDEYIFLRDRQRLRHRACLSRTGFRAVQAAPFARQGRGLGPRPCYLPRNRLDAWWAHLGGIKPKRRFGLLFHDFKALISLLKASFAMNGKRLLYSIPS